MILKVVRGDYFPGLINYIMRRGQYAAKGDTARVIRCSGLYSPLTAAAELWMQASQAPERTKRAVHFIGRAETMLTDEQYIRTVEDGLATMGLGDRPYLLVVHSDGGFHCATVEVDEHGVAPPRRLVSSSLKREVSAQEAAALPEGDAVSRSWDSHVAWRLTQLARQLEVEFDLQRLGPQKDSFDQIRVPDWQLRREAETGLAPLQEILGDRIKSALDLPTWDERADALAVHGLGLRSYSGSNKKRRGVQIFALSEPDHFCNGSDLGKSYGLGAIEKRTEQPFEEWLSGNSPAASPILATGGTTHARPGTTGSAENLKLEFDQLVHSHRNERQKTSHLETEHRQRKAQIKRTVSLLRDKLLATGMVSRAWARIISSIVRAQLNAKEAGRRRKERQQARRLGRVPTWSEFLAQSAANSTTRGNLGGPIEADEVKMGGEKVDAHYFGPKISPSFASFDGGELQQDSSLAGVEDEHAASGERNGSRPFSAFESVVAEVQQLTCEEQVGGTLVTGSVAVSLGPPDPGTTIRSSKNQSQDDRICSEPETPEIKLASVADHGMSAQQPPPSIGHATGSGEPPKSLSQEDGSHLRSARPAQVRSPNGLEVGHDFRRAAAEKLSAGRKTLSSLTKRLRQEVARQSATTMAELGKASSDAPSAIEAAETTAHVSAYREQGPSDGTRPSLTTGGQPNPVPEEKLTTPSLAERSTTPTEVAPAVVAEEERQQPANRSKRIAGPFAQAQSASKKGTLNESRPEKLPSKGPANHEEGELGAALDRQRGGKNGWGR